MAVWKQIVISLAVIAIVALGWYAMFPGARDVLQRFGLNVQAATDNREGAPPGGGGRGRFGGFGGASTVVVQPAETGTINNALSALGTGVAVHSVTVSPMASGTLEEVLVESGARVKAGDVIARLDSEAQKIAVDKARLTLSDAQATYDRYSQLKSANSATAAQVQQYKLAVDTAELNLNDARIDLANREIKSPIDGTIGIVQMDAGNAVTTSTVIATVEDRSSLLVSFWVPERFVGRIHRGDPVKAIPVARPQETVDGTVEAVDNKVDPASGTFEVRALVPNAKDDLVAGMTFTVNMSFPGERFVAVDPLGVQWSSDGAYVWRVREGKAEKAMIDIIQRNTDTVLVSGDVAEGDAIVTEGLAGLRDGQAVQIAGADETGTGGGEAPAAS